MAMQTKKKGDSLGDRMKNNYENRSRFYLIRRMPVIVRIDGKAFHTFTKGFAKPFDDVMAQSMQDTMKYLCENVAGCVLGYTQSDEISLLLTDYNKFETEAWFDNNLQKIVSVSASLATMKFNERFITHTSSSIRTNGFDSVETAHLHATNKGAIFDSRAFNIPQEEVTNYFFWRQLDAIRNSIEMCGHAFYSAKQLHKCSCADIKAKLKNEKNYDWNELATKFQRGSCCKKNDDGHWEIDNEIPEFRGDDRMYIERLVIAREDL